MEYIIEREAALEAEIDTPQFDSDESPMYLRDLLSYFCRLVIAISEELDNYEYSGEQVCDNESSIVMLVTSICHAI
jgi:hypothetical protein